MVTKTISIEYRGNGILTNVYSVILASEDGTFGIEDLRGNVLIPAETVGNSQVTNPSTGTYAYTVNLNEGTIYTISWQIITAVGNTPQYVLQQIGPFSSSGNIYAVTESRGVFNQGSDASIFLQVTTGSGMAIDPDSISLSIFDNNNIIVTDSNNVLLSSIDPLKIQVGYYVWDWLISSTQAPGPYTAAWTYTIDSQEYTVLQTFKVAAEDQNQSQGFRLYSRRIIEMRASLEMMLWSAQHIPVYNEKAKRSVDNQKYKWTFPKWNPCGIEIFRNDQSVLNGITVNAGSGSVSFDTPNSHYDTVFANYNFRWFKDEEFDRFLSNSLSLLNMYPPASPVYDFSTLNLKFVPVVLYGAAIDALRSMMLSIQFTEPQLVFGSQEQAGRVFSNLDTLKKNYETTWKDAIEQKKYQSYKGLTKTIVTPEFALPGGRSRWFRYLFSGSGG